jgi:alpha-1,3-mannosyltransferase
MALNAAGGQAGRRPLRVLHVVRRFWPFVGGIERYVHDLAAAQVAAGRDVRVLTVDRDVGGVEPGRLPKSGSVDGVIVERMAGVGSKRTAIGLRPDRLARAVRWADVVHVHDLRFLFGTALVSARVAGSPVLFHTHGLIFATPVAARLKRLVMRTYYGPLLRLARARVLASSATDADALLALVPALRARTTVVPNAIQLDELLGLPSDPDPGRIVVTGRLVEEKGLRDLIPALQRIDGIAWRLVVAGTEDRSERKVIDGLLEAAGLRHRVTFHGAYTSDQLPELLGRAALAVFPSRAEGFGIALLEAMAAGTPLLARDLPAHRALLGDGLADRLLDSDDPAATARAIIGSLTMADDERASVSAALRDRARGHGIERLLLDIDSVYRELGVTA